MDLDRDHLRSYFSTEGTVERWWTPDEGPLRFHYDAELAVVERYVGFDSTWQVLDVGTGRGRFAVPYARAGCHVVAVDLSRAMLEEATGAAHAAGVAERFEAVQAGAEDLSELGEARFDLALCMELFDHLPDLARALGSIRRALRPGGRFVFTYVPSASLYGALGNAYRAWSRLRRPEEALISRTYDLAGVRRALDAADLRLERYFGIGILCANAQTRLEFSQGLMRPLMAIGRAEARVRPYYTSPVLARFGAHVVGIARAGPKR